MKLPVPPLVGPKDPNARRFVFFDVRRDCLRAKTTLIVEPPPVIVEVDEQRVAVVSPTLTFSTLVLDPAGLIAVMTEGGTHGARPLMQCRYALANGETGDATLRLAIAHT